MRETTRSDEATGPLGPLADAMLELSNAEEVKAIVMLYRGEEGIVGMGGYDDDGGDIEAISDMFQYLRKVMEANGRQLEIITIDHLPTS